MLNGNKGFLIGCLLCFVGLFASGTISLAAFCEGAAFLVSLSVLAFIGRKVYCRIKPCKQAIEARLSRWSRKVFAKKQPRAGKATLMKALSQQLEALEKDMEAFRLSWHEQHKSHQHPELIIPGAYHSFASELQALTKSLNHLSKPKDGRINQDDLKFYQEWAAYLTDRFAQFAQFGVQQEKKVLQALAETRQFHINLGESYEQAQQTQEYWAARGSIATLSRCLSEGYIPAEAILPHLQSVQGEMEKLLDLYEQDALYRLVL